MQNKCGRNHQQRHSNKDCGYDDPFGEGSCTLLQCVDCLGALGCKDSLHLFESGHPLAFERQLGGVNSFRDFFVHMAGKALSHGGRHLCSDTLEHLGEGFVQLRVLRAFLPWLGWPVCLSCTRPLDGFFSDVLWSVVTGGDRAACYPVEGRLCDCC